MSNVTLLRVISAFTLLCSSIASAAEPPDHSLVELPNATHFSASDGTALPAPAGIYRLTSSDTSHLLLTPSLSGQALVVHATATTHTETIGSPTALFVVTSEDETHLLLLLPNHTALDAQGNPRGVRSRAVDFSRTPLNSAQINRAMTLQPPGGTALMAPIPINPPQGAVFTNPTLRIQWQMSPGQPTPSRYEICVSDANQPCSGPTAVIFNSVGVPLREPLLQPQIGLGPLPGAPGFQPPPGEAGPAPYFHTITLPYQFQGKQLHWSVTTCIPYTGPATLNRLAQTETCRTSDLRPLTWTLPAPTLTLPLDNAALATTNRQQLLAQPSFNWNYGNQQGVDYFLVCLFKPGVACPTQPGIQPYTFVARAQNTSTFTVLQNLSTFLGQTLHWTVAACNATVGCMYQQQARRLQIPLTDGSFEALFHVTQQPKCLNCHQMHRENDNYLRHIQVGRFTREQVPPSSIGTVSIPLCQTCHAAATGFTNNWAAPGPHFSFERPPVQICNTIHESFYVALSTTTEEHMMRDNRIMWAADRIPGLGQTRWKEMASAWLYKKGPCPCDQNDRYCKHPSGVFTP